jgi:Holliday junction resolvase-like predicted endonuclease
MRCLGYKIIAKNYRCGSGKNTPYGEIDFIATKKNRIIFCEVKKRNSHKSFWKALSYNQQPRILSG